LKDVFGDALNNLDVIATDQKLVERFLKKFASNKNYRLRLKEA
jgi:transposase-like protein|tara:strand:- start:255 stop:383 length:129 start_codon:yes stop_codon:yes gene_type:complete